jgi:hypothetical protein
VIVYNKKGEEDHREETNNIYYWIPREIGYLPSLQDSTDGILGCTVSGGSDYDDICDILMGNIDEYSGKGFAITNVKVRGEYSQMMGLVVQKLITRDPDPVKLQARMDKLEQKRLEIEALKETPERKAQREQATQARADQERIDKQQFRRTEQRKAQERLEYKAQEEYRAQERLAQERLVKERVEQERLAYRETSSFINKREQEQKQREERLAQEQEDKQRNQVLDQQAREEQQQQQQQQQQERELTSKLREEEQQQRALLYEKVDNKFVNMQDSKSYQVQYSNRTKHFYITKDGVLKYMRVVVSPPEFMKDVLHPLYYVVEPPAGGPAVSNTKHKILYNPAGGFTNKRRKTNKKRRGTNKKYNPIYLIDSIIY